MTDPLSIAAGAAGLLSLSLQSVEYLYNFYVSYRDRDDNLTKTVNRLGELLTTIRSITATIDNHSWQHHDLHLLRHLEACTLQCESAIEEFQEEVTKFKKLPQDDFISSVKKASGRAAHPFRRSTLQKLNEDVDDCLRSFSQALHALQFIEHRHAQNELIALRGVIDHAQAQHLEAEIRHWLRVPDASLDFNAATSKSHKGTGEWFTEHAFQEWEQRKNSFLWLCGFAGCGKTVLLSTAIKQSMSQGLAIGFFFFTFSDQSKQAANACLRALLGQLTGQIIGADRAVERLKRECFDLSPSTDRLLECLKRVVTGQEVYLFLDGLDECPVDSTRGEVLDTINAIRQWHMPGIHLIVTSRDVIDIREALQPETEEVISLKNDDVREDIRHYVSHCVDHDSRLLRWGEKRELIKMHLVQHASGCFRWVDCQIQPLRRCPLSDYDLKLCLATLPKTLDETYERMLTSIDDHLRDRAQKVLVLLSLAQCDLSIGEVIEAVAVDFDDKEQYDVDRRLTDADDILRICPGLVDIIESFDPTDTKSTVPNSRASPIVRISHFSITEYLMSERIRTSSAASFAIYAHKGHTQISKTCLIYLCHNEFLSQPLTALTQQQRRFAKLAARYWPHHFNKGKDSSLTAWGLALRGPETFGRWLELFNPENMYLPSHKNQTFLYYMALLGVADIVQELVRDTSIDVNKCGGQYCNALQAAAAGGHLRVVQALLDAGAEVNVKGQYYGNALHAASRFGSVDVVRLLLEKGADINAVMPYNGSPLESAARGGREQIVRILLEAGASTTYSMGSNPLSTASRRGEERIVRLLLDSKADVNADRGHPLMWAAQYGYDKIVTMLIQAGADLNMYTDLDSHPVNLALRSGYVNIAQLLLDAGAIVDSLLREKVGNASRSTA